MKPSGPPSWLAPLSESTSTSVSSSTPRGFQERDQPREMLVGVVEHRRERRLQAREDALLVGAVLRPCSHAVVARRQPRIRRYEAHRLLPRKPALALDVPAVAENRVVLHDEVARRLMRRVACAEGDPCQPWLIGPRRDVIGDESDRLIDQIFGEVIAALIRARHRDARIVTHQLGRILIRLGVHETVIAIEAAAERPAVEWSRWPRLGQRRDVPFAEHVVAIAVRPQHLGNGAGLARDLAAIARITAVEIGKAADADGMVIAPGEQGRARRRAHRRGMEGGVAQSARCDPVDRRRRNRRAIAAEIGEADVVEQNDQDIGRRPSARAARPARTASSP